MSHLEKSPITAVCWGSVQFSVASWKRAGEELQWITRLEPVFSLRNTDTSFPRASLQGSTAQNHSHIHTFLSRYRTVSHLLNVSPCWWHAVELVPLTCWCSVLLFPCLHFGCGHWATKLKAAAPYLLPLISWSPLIPAIKPYWEILLFAMSCSLASSPWFSLGFFGGLLLPFPAHNFSGLFLFLQP